MLNKKPKQKNTGKGESKNFTVHLPVSTIKIIKQLSDMENRTSSKFIDEIVFKYSQQKHLEIQKINSLNKQMRDFSKLDDSSKGNIPEELKEYEIQVEHSDLIEDIGVNMFGEGFLAVFNDWDYSNYGDISKSENYYACFKLFNSNNILIYQKDLENLKEIATKKWDEFLEKIKMEEIDR